MFLILLNYMLLNCKDLPSEYYTKKADYIRLIFIFILHVRLFGTYEHVMLLKVKLQKFQMCLEIGPS